MMIKKIYRTHIKPIINIITLRKLRHWFKKEVALRKCLIPIKEIELSFPSNVQFLEILILGKYDVLVLHLHLHIGL